MTVPFFPSQRCPLCGEPAAWRYRDPICESCKGAEMSKFDNPDYAAGYRSVLALIDEQYVAIERTLRTTGQPRTTRDDLRGRLDALKSAQTVMVRRLNALEASPDAPQSPTANERAENDLDHLNGHDAPTQGKSEGAAA